MGEEVLFPIRIGDKISFRCIQDKICIGYPDEEDNIIPCISNNMISKRIQCRECLRKDVLFGCVFCKGTTCVNENAWRYCQDNKHILYLALYTNNFIKVGTAKSDRALTRLLEQGAKEAIIVAEFKTQMEAKFYERQVSTNLGIPDRSNKKVQINAILQDTINGEDLLRKKNLKISSAYPKLNYLGEYVVLYKNKNSLNNSEVYETKGEVKILGIVNHIQGKYILIGNKLINFREMVGREIMFFKEEDMVLDNRQKCISDF